MLEKDIENEYVKYAESRGCKAFKLVMLNRRGWPDRVTLGHGKIVIIEFKRPGGKLSKSQIKIKSIIESLGFTYYVCYDAESAKRILDNALDSA